MSHYPSRDGHDLHIHVLGRGKPVVLLHGLGASGRQWLPFIWPHLRRYRFYIPDLRAMGRSANVSYNQPDIFQNHVEDLEDLLAHFKLNRVLLGGHSLGNTISLHWQRSGGFDQVERYLHIDQSACVRNQADWNYGVFGHEQDQVFAGLAALRQVLSQHPDAEIIADLPFVARRELLDAIGQAFARITGQGVVAKLLPLLAQHPKLLQRRFPVKRLADLDTLLHSYLNAHDYRDSLQGCRTPTTLMVGMQSPIYDPRGQLAMADWLHDCTVVPFERAGHLPPFQQPLKFTREFSRFLKKH